MIWWLMAHGLFPRQHFFSDAFKCSIVWSFIFVECRVLDLVYASEQIEQDFIDFSRHIEPQLFESLSSKESIHFPLPVDDSLKEQVKFISFLLPVKHSTIDWSVTLKSGFSMLQWVNFHANANWYEITLFQIKRFHLLLTVKDSAMDIPVNLEARRRISFFATSMFMNVPKAPKVSNMMSFRLVTFPISQGLVVSTKHKQYCLKNLGCFFSIKKSIYSANILVNSF